MATAVPRLVQMVEAPRRHGRHLRRRIAVVGVTAPSVAEEVQSPSEPRAVEVRPGCVAVALVVVRTKHRFRSVKQN